MFARLILYLFLSIIAANTLVRAGSNRISSSAVQVNEPLTDAEVQQIQSNEWWPSQTVKLGAEADDETFASLKQIPRIRFLELANANQKITSFESIRSLPNLVSFRASRPRLNQDKPWSVAALAHCKNLIYLNLDRTLITDENSLSACTKLRYLNLVGSGISSLNCLNSMPALQDLYLDDSDALIASYAPLGSLEQLKQLSIKGSKSIDETDFKALSKLTQIQQFSCSGSGIKDLQFLANCTLMERLNVSRNEQLENIEAVKNMRYLKIAYLSYTQVGDLSAFSGNHFLEDLGISNSAVVSLAGLEQCEGLRKIDLSTTAVQSLQALGRKPYLTRLALVNTSDIDLQTLSYLPRLEEVDLRGSAVTDISALAQQLALKRLSLQKTSIDHLSDLSALSGLEQLSLSKDRYPESELEVLRASIPMLRIAAY